MNFSRIEPGMLCRFVGNADWLNPFTFLTLSKDSAEPEWWNCGVDDPEAYLDASPFINPVWEFGYGIVQIREPHLEPLPPPPMPELTEEKEKELES